MHTQASWPGGLRNGGSKVQIVPELTQELGGIENMRTGMQAAGGSVGGVAV